MGVRETFDEWANEGKDQGMAERHWHTAKHALARMPVEPGDRVLDLGTGSGYALRALRERDIGIGIGIDASREMVANARSYTDDPFISYVRGDFESLPFCSNAFDHCFSMEALFFAAEPRNVLRELRRVLTAGATVYCAVDFYEENHFSHVWPERTGLEMTLWSRAEYREAFREAGFHVAAQDNVPNREIEIPPASEFPTEDFETREEMVERHHELGTLLTVGVVP